MSKEEKDLILYGIVPAIEENLKKYKKGNQGLGDTMWTIGNYLNTYYDITHFGMSVNIPKKGAEK